MTPLQRGWCAMPRTSMPRTASFQQPRSLPPQAYSDVSEAGPSLSTSRYRSKPHGLVTERVVDPLDQLEREIMGRQPPPPEPNAYRLGPRADPVGFVPWELCSWRHRWDDPRQEYRTLYCARSAATCLREALADLRPNAKALAELRAVEGALDVDIARGVVSRTWLRSHILEGATLWHRGPLAEVEDLATRRALELEHAALLVKLGLDHLDISDVRSGTRPLTQAISRSLWEQGAAGVQYRSNLDDGICFALFEGRAGLLPVGVGVPFSESELLELSARYQLGVAPEPVVEVQPVARHGDRRQRERRKSPSVGYSGPERRRGSERRATGASI
jgi:hypothetical protein